MRRVTAPSGRVAIVGAGTTPLVAELASGGYAIVAVDISATALSALRTRIGTCARVEFLVADVRTVRLTPAVDTWHDRAVFHFLVDPADRQSYVTAASASVRSGGYVVIATFAPGGPDQCNGLPVIRHDAASLRKEFSEDFELIEASRVDHLTPWNATQPFTHVVFRRH